MQQTVKYLFAILLVCLLSSSVLAAETEDTPRSWADEAELSYVKGSGNSALETLSAKNLFTLIHSDKWKSFLKASALNGKSDGERTTESYTAELRSDYAFSKRLYTLLLTGWLKDNFAGIDARSYVGLGLVYKVLNGPKHFISTEAGGDYVKEEYTDDTQSDFLRGRLFALYEYRFSKKNKFSQSVEYLYDFDDSKNYNVNTETALISSLNDYWSMKASYAVKYDNRPVPATLEKKDAILSMALVLNI